MKANSLLIALVVATALPASGFAGQGGDGPGNSDNGVCSNVSVDIRAVNENGEDVGSINRYSASWATVDGNALKTDGSAMRVCGENHDVSVWVTNGAAPVYLWPSFYRVIIKKDGQITYDHTAQFNGKHHLGGAL